MKLKGLKASLAVCMVVCLSTLFLYLKHHSLRAALDFYGIATHEQKSALEHLFQITGVTHSLKLENTFPKRSKKSELTHDLINMIDRTQEKLTIRKRNQERWEVQATVWNDQQKTILLKHLITLGFVEDVLPIIKKPDVICVLGSTKKGMSNRLTFTDKLLSSNVKTRQLVMLVGERYITAGVDGTAKELEEIALRENTQAHKLTETSLMVDLYKHSALIKRKIPAYIIDSPKGKLSRPTTQSTLLDLVKWLRRNPTVRTILFISSQPHVKYQKALIKSIFQAAKMKVKVDVVGPAVENMENVHHILEGLGGFLWAQTPYVLSKLGAPSKPTPDLIEKIKKHYWEGTTLVKTLPSALQ